MVQHRLPCRVPQLLGYKGHRGETQKAEVRQPSCSHHTQKINAGLRGGCSLCPLSLCACTPCWLRGGTSPQNLHQLIWFSHEILVTQRRRQLPLQFAASSRRWRLVSSEESVWTQLTLTASVHPCSPAPPATLSSWLRALLTSGLAPKIQKQQPHLTCLTSS